MSDRATYRFVAGEGDARERLDKFVVMRLEGAGAKSSRGAVQRWVRAGNVTLDGRRPSPSDRVSVGSVVEVTPMPPETTDLEPDAEVRFDVLFEDAHLIVIEKPGGLVVHPARGHVSGTLVHGLLARGAFDRFPRLLEGATGDEATAFARPGIVHRLDKGTSGVMVVAKDEATREGLKAQFARHDIERAYQAIVVGKVTGPDAFGARLADRTFDTLHGRHPTQRLKFTTHVPRGRRAVTRVHVLERLADGNAALVECRLATGRTHQIRVHLAECAHTPILGDPLYGRPPRDPFLKSVGEALGRQALHAAVLGFIHPKSGDQLRFERDPPADFRRALEALRGRPPSPPAKETGGGRASSRGKRSR